jgi:hypothetical protein
MENGKYEVYRTRDGKKVKVGFFTISDSTISFENEDQELAMDQIPAGPMSKRTTSLVQSIIDGKHNSLDIKKV